ncbi:MAG: DUF805 domain-containing protein [Alistipes sp.]|nr:DUF805 domain-containing protein [Alistipes sp.]
MEWYLKCMKQYVDFSGRARRKEYWMFALMNAIIAAALIIIDAGLGDEVLQSVYSLVVFLPSLAVGVRRMHDIGKSGWWLLIGLIPLIGSIWLIVLACQDSEPGANRWGANPKE